MKYLGGSISRFIYVYMIIFYTITIIIVIDDIKIIIYIMNICFKKRCNIES